MVDIASVCVFCGSSTPQDTRYREAARALGTLVASKGISLVYGGGRIGMMGALADAGLAAGGRVVGVIPTGLFNREVAHTELTELHEVGSMHERKQLMYDLSDAFVALPGGLGTLEELAEVVTWTQLGLHRKPAVLLDVDGFWDPCWPSWTEWSVTAFSNRPGRSSRPVDQPTRPSTTLRPWSQSSWRNGSAPKGDSPAKTGPSGRAVGEVTVTGVSTLFTCRYRADR